MSLLSLRRRRDQPLLAQQSSSMWITVSQQSHIFVRISKLIKVEMEVMMEETFGPVVGIMKVESDEEALSLMNDSPYGLVSTTSPFLTRGHEILIE